MVLYIKAQTMSYSILYPLSHHHHPPHKQTTLAIPWSLTCWPQCYDAPWLGCYRHKPTAADNAPDGDAPSLPDKQDAQPWGETHGHLLLPMFPPAPPPTPSGIWAPADAYSPVYRLIPTDFRNFFTVCIVCVSASALTPLTFFLSDSLCLLQRECFASVFSWAYL